MRHGYILPPRVGPALGAGLALVTGALCWGHTVDDAYIVGRYAQRIAAGQGYTFTAGAETDGVTGPLWLVPGVLATIAGIDAVVVAKLAGLLFMALAVAHWLTWLGRCSGGARVMPWAAVALGLSPWLGAWGVGGLETGLASWLFALAAVAALGQPSRPVRLGVCGGLLAWLRPELALAVGVLLLADALRRPREEPVINRQDANAPKDLGLGSAPTWAKASWRLGALAVEPRALAIASAGAISVVLFRWWMFGNALPLSWAAKPGALGVGVDYVLRSWAWITGLLGVGALWARGGRRAYVLLALCAAHSLALIVGGGDWMPGFRLMVPLVPAITLAIALGAARLLGRRRWLAASAWMAGPLLASAVGLALQVSEIGEVQRSRDGVGRELATQLAHDFRRVALVDVGYLAYGSDLEVIDLAGVTDPRIGRLPGVHGSKEVPASWLVEQAPDAIVLHSRAEPIWDAQGNLQRLDGFPVERGLAASAEVRDGFRVAHSFRYAPAYHYVLLTRRSATAIAPRRATVAK